MISNKTHPPPPGSKKISNGFYKRTEYAARGIAEYWIVDPIAQKVTVLEWVEGLYEEKVFVGDTTIESSVLKHLDLTVDRVLQGR